MVLKKSLNWVSEGNYPSALSKLQEIGHFSWKDDSLREQFLFLHIFCRLKMGDLGPIEELIDGARITSFPLLFLRGYFYCRTHQYERAVSCFREIFERRPDYPNLAIFYTLALLGQDRGVEQERTKVEIERIVHGLENRSFPLPPSLEKPGSGRLPRLALRFWGPEKLLSFLKNVEKPGKMDKLLAALDRHVSNKKGTEEIASLVQEEGSFGSCFSTFYRAILQKNDDLSHTYTALLELADTLEGTSRGGKMELLALLVLFHLSVIDLERYLRKATPHLKTFHLERLSLLLEGMAPAENSSLYRSARQIDSFYRRVVKEKGSCR